MLTFLYTILGDIRSLVYDSDKKHQLGTGFILLISLYLILILG